MPKKLPTRVDEIPEYLYAPGTKQHETARIIIFEGLDDNKIIADRVGLKAKSVSNVRSTIRKVVKEMIEAQERASGKPQELASFFRL